MDVRVGATPAGATLESGTGVMDLSNELTRAPVNA
jgi:hypothetical protein